MLPWLRLLTALVLVFNCYLQARAEWGNDDEIDTELNSVSNWGRWGNEDQLGTLNYLTDASRLRAAGLIRTGRTVSLARPLSMLPANLRKGSYHLLSYTDPAPGESGCLDNIAMVFHGFKVTHIDALCHFFTPLGSQGMYNGFSLNHITPTGATRLGVETMGERGIVGRGVLLDVAALRGRPLEPGSAIYPSDLEAAEKLAGVRVGEGDILFIRNGAGDANQLTRASGLHPSCLPWLHQRRVAVLGGDSDNDVHPPLPGLKRWAEPIHMIALPYMGLPLLDQAELEALSLTCKEYGRWEFFVSLAPWRFIGTTASPVNPLAVF
ncbi:cyclase family protein [bacterium]|nr:cyclase family protein [bacterium]